MNRVLWDDVPADIKHKLGVRTLNESPQDGAIAIVDCDDGRRWYFEKVEAGWNNLNVGPGPTQAEVADDLDDKQRDDALAGIMERCTKAVPGCEPTAPRANVHREEGVSKQAPDGYIGGLNVPTPSRIMTVNVGGLAGCYGPFISADLDLSNMMSGVQEWTAKAIIEHGGGYDDLALGDVVEFRHVIWTGGMISHASYACKGVAVVTSLNFNFGLTSMEIHLQGVGMLVEFTP